MDSENEDQPVIEAEESEQPQADEDEVKPDEGEAEEEEEKQPSVEEKKATVQKAPQSFIPTVDDEDACNEAKIRMEEMAKKKHEIAEDDFEEYEARRKEEREIQEREIRELRERREQRKQERAEEEKRLAELRAVEEQKRRSEEEERQRKKREEEQRRKEEREKKRMESAERHRSGGKPNFTIVKTAADGNVAEQDEEEAKPQQKTKEQLEAEKRAVLESRCTPLQTQGMNADKLKEKARELYEHIRRLESEKYDLCKRFESQNYDLMEMTEKARQLAKGGGKNPKVNVPQTPDPLASKYSGIPHKVSMYSQYERVKDHRTFGEKRDVFSGPLYSEEYEKIEPTHRVVMTEQGATFAEGGPPPPMENNVDGEGPEEVDAEA